MLGLLAYAMINDIVIIIVAINETRASEEKRVLSVPGLKASAYFIRRVTLTFFKARS